MFAKYWQFVDICHRFPARAPNEDTFSNMTDTEKPIPNFIVTLFQLYAKEALLPNAEAIHTVKGVQASTQLKSLKVILQILSQACFTLLCHFYIILSIPNSPLFWSSFYSNCWQLKNDSTGNETTIKKWPWFIKQDLIAPVRSKGVDKLSIHEHNTGLKNYGHDGLPGQILLRRAKLSFCQPCAQSWLSIPYSIIPKSQEGLPTLR